MKGNEGKSIMGAGWVAGEEEKIENFPHGFNKYELPTEVISVDRGGDKFGGL